MSSRARRRAPSVSSSPMATPAATLAVLRASRPRCRHAADVLAFAVHAATTSAGFRLVAAGPRAKDPSAAAAPSDPSADPLDGWDAWEDTHAFRYVPETTHRSARLVRDETSSSSMDETRGDEDDVREATVTSLAVGDACVVSVSVVRRSGDSAGRPEKETATLQVPLAQHVDASLASTDPAGALRDVDALVALAEEKLFVRLLKKQKRPRARDDATARDDGEREPCQATDDRYRTDDRPHHFEGPRPPSALASTCTARRISPRSRPGALGTKTTIRAASPKIIIQTPRSAGSLTDSTPLGPAGPSRAAAGFRREGGVGDSLLRDGLPRADAVAGRRTGDRRRGAEADSFDAAFEAAFRGETRGTRKTRDARDRFGSVPRGGCARRSVM